MFDALRVVRYHVPDVPGASHWYAQFLGAQPLPADHDDEIRFDLGGFELQLARGPVVRGGSVVYWGVEDLEAVSNRLDGLGAEVHLFPVEPDPRVKRAWTSDPYGNMIGLVQRDDPEARRARAHRVAEKVALRSVRDRLDILHSEDAERRGALRVVGTVLAVLALVGGAYIASLVSERAGRTPAADSALLRAPAR